MYHHVGRITISCTCWCSFHVWLHESLVLLRNGYALDLIDESLTLSSCIFTKVSSPLTYHFFKQRGWFRFEETAWFRSSNFPSRKISGQILVAPWHRRIRGDPVIPVHRGQVAWRSCVCVLSDASAAWGICPRRHGFSTKKSRYKKGGPNNQC